MFISRFLLVAVLAYLFNLLMVKCAPPPPNSQYLNRKPLTRNCTLFHKCSGGFVEIRNKKILAKPITMSRLKYVQLELITDVPSANLDELGLKIYNPSVDRYLCFNQKGKIITRFVYKEEYCKFKDFMGESTYSEFRLVSRPDWRVGFNSKGRALVAESTGGGGGDDKDKLRRRPTADGANGGGGGGGGKVNRNCLSFIPQCDAGGLVHQIQHHHHLRHKDQHHRHPHLHRHHHHHHQPSALSVGQDANSDSQFSAMLSARVLLQTEQQRQKQHQSSLQRHKKIKDRNKS